jgi:hypothetical protein
MKGTLVEVISADEEIFCYTRKHLSRAGSGSCMLGRRGYLECHALRFLFEIAISLKCINKLKFW